MARVTASANTRKRHKKILKLAKGFRGRAKNCFRVAVQKVEKALQYAYRDRKARKRDLRALWIQRINAAVRIHNLTYSQFIDALTKADILIDRKILADMAVHNPDHFKIIVEKAKDTLKTAYKEAA